MTTRLENFQNHFNDVIESVQKYAILVRGRIFQETSIQTLQLLLAECSQNKSEAIKKSQEDAANAFLVLECRAQALMEEFKFYLALKDDRIDEAWDNLINAESFAASAVKTQKVSGPVENYINRLHLFEELLFPKPMYLNSAIIIDKSVCSICGTDYGDCDHVIGRAYMGELCERVIRKFRVKDVSGVSDATDRHWRALYSLEGDKRRSAFSHQIVSAENMKALPNREP